MTTIERELKDRLRALKEGVREALHLIAHQRVGLGTRLLIKTLNEDEKRSEQRPPKDESWQLQARTDPVGKWVLLNWLPLQPKAHETLSKEAKRFSAQNPFYEVRVVYPTGVVADVWGNGKRTYPNADLREKVRAERIGVGGGLFEHHPTKCYRSQVWEWDISGVPCECPRGWPRQSKKTALPGNETCTKCQRSDISICCDGPKGERWCAKCCKCELCHKELPTRERPSLRTRSKKTPARKKRTRKS